ncbi:hypothetical protein BKA70DRAFT_1300985 [Coprinopsis sp. MPI-PUGE-AT-0042]|nr:hypothetical protein BKA70DRAFT_1300985 [Coprinopsis sp. MPI-PUGE-AT-0042]
MRNRSFMLTPLFSGSLAAALQSIFYGGATLAFMPAAGAVIASAGAVGTGIASLFSSASEEAVENDEEAPPPPYSSRMPGPPERTIPGEK